MNLKLKNKVTVLLVSCLFIFSGCDSDSKINPWITGEGSPQKNSISVSKNGDMYLDTSTYDLYQVEDEDWVKVGNISGTDGKDGKTPIISISEDGYLVVNDEKTGTKVVGENGKDGLNGKDGKDGRDGKDGITPTISINKDGYLVINNVTTNLKAKIEEEVCYLFNDVDNDKQADIGDEIACNTEHFNVMRNDGNNITMLAKYNLDVGNIYDNATKVLTPISNPTGIQSNKAFAFNPDAGTRYGTIEFSEEYYWDNGILKMVYGESYPAYIYDSNSTLFKYIQEYKTTLIDMGVKVTEARPVALDELRSLGCSKTAGSCVSSSHKWLYNTSFWTGTAEDGTTVWRLNKDGKLSNYDPVIARGLGIRPVIVIPESELTK